ncbi:hypothetical protein [Pedobacter nutrimenti]|uniref:hypothetical protein n=1 Tax=Pedobacter nutrimenti TaxID=1241337 RepID=UPI00292CCC19|nr:hypothetical protein [Pedobacter nutrimenti]
MIIETYHHKGGGYNPFFIKDNWQVAQLNYMPELGFRSIEKLEKHMETDEIFILTKGIALLIIGLETATELQFQLTKMEPGVTYNVPVNAWHNIAMSTDAEVIIVEKSNTHLGDFIYRHLDKTEQENLVKKISSLL